MRSLGRRPTVADPPLLLAAILAAALLACGGGGGGGGGVTAPTPSPPTAALIASYVPSGGVADNSLSWRSVAAGGQDRLRLELVASSVEDLYGVSFDLAYPSTLLRYDSVDEGEAFSAAGQFSTTLLVAPSDDDGVLIVGLSRLGNVEGFAGSGTLLMLELTALRAGSGAVAFVEPAARDHRGRIKADVSWVGGSVTVQ